MGKRKSGVPLINPPMADEYIFNYMKENNITQTELAEALGITQSRVSAIKNGGGHFDFEDICNFALVYEQSIDEMVDLAERSESTSKREKSFKDVLSRLFYIHSSEVGSVTLYDMGDNCMRISIDITGREMTEILKQWETASKLNVTDKSGQQIIDIVKESLLKQASDLKARYDYQSELAYVLGLHEMAVQALKKAGYHEPHLDVIYDEYTGQVEKVSLPLKRDSFELLRKYFNNTYVVDEIDILINENAAVFFDDLFFDIPSLPANSD